MALQGKKVLMRVDFNVPIDKDGRIIDDNRIRAALPTIVYIISQKAKLILMSHLGRPDGKRQEKYSLSKLAKHLEDLLNQSVSMLDDCIGDDVKKSISSMQDGEILMLENLRFHEGEENKDIEFCNELASLADIYVNDAFGVAHRDHVSTASIAKILPSYAGFLLENEVKMLKTVLEYPESPRVAILGGSKVKDKLFLIENLLDKMDIILIGGGMANTFLKAKGYEIGKSIYENDLLEEARNIMKKASERATEIILPIDLVVANEISDQPRVNVVSLTEVPLEWLIVDIGPRTSAEFGEVLKKARTVVWNGPLGVYENKYFAKGTEQVAKSLAQSDAVSLIGGGDTVAVINNLGLEDKITHISTGGGATLEFLEGKKLPGVLACGG